MNDDLWLSFRKNTDSYNELKIDMYIRNGGDIKFVHRNDQTFLHIATFYNHVQCIKKLVELGINVNCVDTPDQFTPLHCAVRHENRESVLMLLQLGADPTMKSNLGKTPMDFAISILNSPNRYTTVDIIGIIKILEDWPATNIESKPAGKRK